MVFKVQELNKKNTSFVVFALLKLLSVSLLVTSWPRSRLYDCNLTLRALRISMPWVYEQLALKVSGVLLFKCSIVYWIFGVNFAYLVSYIMQNSNSSIS